MLDTTYNLKKVAIGSLVVLLVAVSVSYYYLAHSTKTARGQVATNTMLSSDPNLANGVVITTGRESATVSFCTGYSAWQSAVVVFPDPGDKRATVLTSKIEPSVQSPGTRFKVGSLYTAAPFCTDPTTLVQYFQYPLIPL